MYFRLLKNARITRHCIYVAHHYIYHSQISIEHYVFSPPGIPEYLEDIDISRQCTGTPVMASKNMLLYFKPNEVFIFYKCRFGVYQIYIYRCIIFYTVLPIIFSGKLFSQRNA